MTPLYNYMLFILLLLMGSYLLNIKYPNGHLVVLLACFFYLHLGVMECQVCNKKLIGGRKVSLLLWWLAIFRRECPHCNHKYNE